jgi:zinc protease
MGMTLIPARAWRAFLAAVLFSLCASAAQAMTIERVVSPGGIEAWLVHDKTVPLIAVNFAFRGGASQDPAGKPGTASLTARLLDEGAGPLDSKAFSAEAEKRAISISFSAGHDSLRGSLRTLSANRGKAFELLKLALTAPRFDPEAVERVRLQVLAQLKREATDPNDIASRRWWATAFRDHPYAHPVSGTLDAVPTITPDDLRGYSRRVLAKDTLKIAVVGDIDAASVAAMLDDVFGPLPKKAQLNPVPAVSFEGLGQRIVVQLDVPQAVVTFGGPGIGRKDPDFMAAFIVNHILGGGSFSSRLYREVREKRGLAYSVHSSLMWLDHAALFMGGTGTRAERTGETVDIIQKEIRRLAEAGPTEEELAKAKSFLKGSYLLAFDTSTKIAGQLVQIQMDGLGIDYIERRSGMIDAVTLDDARRVAKRLLNEGLLIAVVGRPEGMPAKD